MAFVPLSTLALLLVLAPSATQQAKRAHDEAAVLFDLGRYAEAAALFEQAYRLRPDRVGILFNAAAAHEQAYRLAGDPHELERAVELYRSCRAVRCATTAQVDAALVELGRAKAERERAREAEVLRGATGNVALALGARMVEKGRPAEARMLAERVLQETGNDRERAIEARRLLAYAAARTGDEAASVRAFREALTLLPALPPPMAADAAARRAFDKAVASLPIQPALEVTLVPLGDLQPRLPAQLPLEVRVDPAQLVRTIVVAVRRGQGAYAELRFAHPGELPIIPAQFLGALGPGAVVEYYVRVLGEHETVLAGFGAADRPFTTQMATPAPPRRPDLVTLHPPIPEKRSVTRTLAIASTIAGGLGLAGGAVVWAVAKVLELNLVRSCPDGRCPPGSHASLETYERLRSLAYTSLAIGGVLAAGGVTVWVFGPEDGSLRPGGIGIALSGRF